MHSYILFLRLRLKDANLIKEIKKIDTLTKKYKFYPTFSMNETNYYQARFLILVQKTLKILDI